MELVTPSADDSLRLTEKISVFRKKSATSGEIDAAANCIIDSKRGAIRFPLSLIISEEGFPIISVICPGFLLPAREPFERSLAAREAYSNHATHGVSSQRLGPNMIEPRLTRPSTWLVS